MDSALCYGTTRSQPVPESNGWQQYRPRRPTNKRHNLVERAFARLKQFRAPEAFDRAVAVNLRGTFFLTQAFAKQLLDDADQPDEGRYRSIIIVSSIAAKLVSVDRAQYNVTKSALSMVAKLYAARLAAHGIHVHEVRPGLIETAMTASAGNTIADDWITDGRVPIPRWGQKEDVGRAVASLAAGRLPYMTGQPIWISGGLNIKAAP